MFDGSDAELAEVLDEVRTFSLLGGRRIVVVSGADPFVSRHRAALEALLRGAGRLGDVDPGVQFAAR
jgi:DNA polymerase III delta subunit